MYVVAMAKRNRGRESELSGFRFEREPTRFRISYNESQIVVPESAAFVSGLALLGLGALIGPLVIGVALTAISIGTAVSIGAIAISTMFVPMAFLILGFSGFAMFGMVAQLLPLAIIGAGVAIWFQISKPAQVSTRSNPKIMEVDPNEEEARRVSQELRDFDSLLADREYSKRVDKWKQR